MPKKGLFCEIFDAAHADLPENGPYGKLNFTILHSLFQVEKVLSAYLDSDTVVNKWNFHQSSSIRIFIFSWRGQKTQGVCQVCCAFDNSTSEQEYCIVGRST